MESIVKLLFGREAENLAKLFTPDDRANSDMADRARRAGEWCASTPGRGATRTRPIRPRGINRDFPGR
jgi:hypothetical protein